MHKTIQLMYLSISCSICEHLSGEILRVAHEIRIDKGILFAKSWQDLVTGEGGGGSRGGGARRGGVGGRRRRHRKHLHPLPAPRPRSSFGILDFIFQLNLKISLNMQFPN